MKAGKMLIGMICMGMVLMGCADAKKNESLPGTDSPAGIEDSAAADICDEINDSAEADALTEKSDFATAEGEQDYEWRLEEAIALLEEQLVETKNADNIGLSEEFTDAINGKLPEYIRLRDSRQGDIGSDGKYDIAIVLQFTKDYPYETGDGMMAYGENVLCIFTERSKGNYQCRYRNNRLIRDDGSGGLIENPYAGIEICDGLLTVSDYSGSADRRGEDYTFGFGKTGDLELFGIRLYVYNTNTGEGTVEYYDFQTGTAEGYNIENCNEDEPLTRCFKRSFSVDPKQPVLFEDTEGGQLHEIDYE